LVDMSVSPARTWHDAALTHPGGNLRLHDLFDQQAARTPDDVALVCEQKSLTYRELAGRAGRLARHLRTMGAGPDVLVGLLVER